MRLSKVRVRNFRCIKDISVDLEDTTVLIGENNSGKTAFLEAIRICLSQLRARSGRVFHEYDYHLPDDAATPMDSEPIVIELFFIEPEPGSWNDDIIQELGDVAVIGDDERYLVQFRLSSGFDRDSNDFISNWAFLDPQGNPLTRATGATQLNTLQRMAPVFYLSALRDAAAHFGPRGRFWRNFLSESSIPDIDRQRLEQEFSDLNERLIAVHHPLSEVRAGLEQAKKVIDFGVGDAVGIDAMPTKLFSLLSRTQVSLSSPAGAKIPVDRQGEGTQSLAVLLLFGTFLRSRLSDLDAAAEPITALEEPEAHLHPSAIRALMQVVHALPGQKLVSSHSGDLLASVDALSVRRFVRWQGGIDIHRIRSESLNAEEMRKFDFHVRRSRGELLFARCWLLVEGETETALFSGVADALNLDLERAGVRCVEFGQTDVGMLAKVANQLGIRWYCVIDNDSGANRYRNAARDQLDDAEEVDRIILPYENVERFLCETGFGGLYEARMSGQKRQPEAARGAPGYWEQVLAALPNRYSKPEVAVEAVLKMREGEEAVPETLRSIIERAIELAKW